MQDIALMAAGVLGVLVALVHSYLVRQKMTAPLASVLAKDAQFMPAVGRLVPLLLDFSGYNWFLGGVLLISAPFWLGAEGIAVAALAVGSSYLFAAIGNCWGTRGRHPGWVLMAFALVLLIYGAWRPLG